MNNIFDRYLHGRSQNRQLFQLPRFGAGNCGSCSGPKGDCLASEAEDAAAALANATTDATTVLSWMD